MIDTATELCNNAFVWSYIYIGLMIILVYNVIQLLDLHSKDQPQFDGLNKSLEINWRFIELAPRTAQVLGRLASRPPDDKCYCRLQGR